MVHIDPQNFQLCPNLRGSVSLTGSVLDTVSSDAFRESGFNGTLTVKDLDYVQTRAFYKSKFTELVFDGIPDTGPSGNF
jgi:hypothetical protein